MNRHLQGHLLLPVRPEQPRLRQDLAAKRLLLASSSCQRSQGTWRSRPSRRKRPGRQHRRPRGSTRTSGISFACWMAVGGPGSHNSRDPGFPRWAGARASVSAAPPRSCSWSCGADAAGSWQRFDTAPLLPESNAAPGLLQKPLFSLSLSLSLFFYHIVEEEAGQEWLRSSRYPGRPRPTRSLQPQDWVYFLGQRGSVGKVALSD